MTDAIYHELLLDLYKHPLNKRVLPDCDARQTEHNPSCGDTIEVCVKWDTNNAVKAVAWQGDGCAVSQAAASILTEKIKGKKRNAIKKISNQKMLQLLGLKNLNPTRLRCATLCLETLKKICR